MIRHLPIDPLSCVALALLCAHVAMVQWRRRSQRAHLGRFFRTLAEAGRTERGAR